MLFKDKPATLRDSSNLKGLNFKMNLQLFAEGGEENNNSATTTEGQLEGQESKTYTEEEVNTLLQSETDKRVTTALKTAREKWEKEVDEKLNTKIKEAETLAQMTEKEKQEHLLKERERELEEKEKAIALKDLRFAAIDILTEKELPITLVDTLIDYELDAEKTKENIDKFEKVFREEIEKAVNERLKGPTPKIGSSKETNPGSIYAEQRNKTVESKLNLWK